VPEFFEILPKFSTKSELLVMRLHRQLLHHSFQRSAYSTQLLRRLESGSKQTSVSSGATRNNQGELAINYETLVLNG